MLLHTSYRNLDATVEWIRPRLEEAGITLHVQREAPTGRLIERMRADETSVLAGTTSFWEGVDVPGDALGLVVIDKLPFPRRGDPLLDARREAAEAAGGSGFEEVDIPATATLLAQGAGRLLRRVDDVGVVGGHGLAPGDARLPPPDPCDAAAVLADHRPRRGRTVPAGAAARRAAA